MRVLLALAVVLAVAAMASAGLRAEIERNADPQGDLTSWTVYFRGDAPGDALASFDGRTDGTLSQIVWEAINYRSTLYVDFWMPGEEAIQAVDTHLLIEGGHLELWAFTKENFDFGNIIETLYVGGDAFHRSLGTYLAGRGGGNMAFSIRPAYRSTDCAFAQVVVPRGEAAWISSVAITNDGSRLEIRPPVRIPEPAAVALLALGGSAVSRRRRTG